MRKLLGIPCILILIAIYSFNMKPSLPNDYIDGNNNTYTIGLGKIFYTPITKEESSSGTYSGGEKKEIMITEAQFLKIDSIIHLIVPDKKNHIKKRLMGCSTLYLSASRKRIYIKSSSKNKALLEAELNALLGK